MLMRTALAVTRHSLHAPSLLLACGRAQVADFRRSSGAQARCGLCFASAARPRHLTIAIGHTAYLALPAGCAPKAPSQGHALSGTTLHDCHWLQCLQPTSLQKSPRHSL